MPDEINHFYKSYQISDGQLISKINDNRQFRISIIVMLASVVLLFYSFWTLYSRYYIYPVYETISIECNADELTEKNLFVTSMPDIFLENGNRQSNKYSRSGHFSVELFSNEPFGFTYRFYSGQKDAVLKVEVWRFGESGEIVMSGESGETFFQTSSKVVATDANGWEKLALSYTLKRNMEGKEIGIYLYNPSRDTSYFDDITIAVDKRE